MAVSLVGTGLAGNILNSGMPCFCTKLATQTNVTGDNTKVPANAAAASNLSVTAERFDLGGDVTGGLFTAPVAGRYHLAYIMGISGVTSGNSYGNSNILTSNQGYVLSHSYNWWNWINHGSGVNWVCAIEGSILADMDANDTAHADLAIYEISKTVDISDTYFMGALVC